MAWLPPLRAVSVPTELPQRAARQRQRLQGELGKLEKEREPGAEICPPRAGLREPAG